MNDLKFESIATSIEQSNMLVKEFGMDIGTADMFWSTDFGILICSEYLTDNNLVPAVNACPAWSLTRLIKLMPTLTEYGRLSMVRNGEEVIKIMIQISGLIANLLFGITGVLMNSETNKGSKIGSFIVIY